MKWKLWLKGLISAVVGGAANAVAALYVDPQTFGLSGDGLVNLLKLATAGAIIALFGYLKQSPIPPEKNTKAASGLVSLILVCLLVPALACHRQTPTPHPGAVDQFDSDTYDALLVAQGVLDQAKIEYTQGQLPIGAQVVINQAGQAYNVTRDLWLEYRAVKQAGQAESEVERVRLQVEAAVSGLNNLVKDLRELIRPARTGVTNEGFGLDPLHHRAVAHCLA